MVQNRIKVSILLIFTMVLCAFITSCQADANVELFSKLKKLAEQGNPEAQYHVGMMLNNGIGVTKNPQQAFEWFQKSAKSGDALGAYKVGCYYGGQFQGVVPVNEEKSLENKLVSATAGYSLAQYDVGVKYYNQGKFDEALEWWKLAGEQGFGSALYNMSVIYQEGKVVPQDLVLAYIYLKLAISLEQGNSKEAQEALNNLKAKLTSEQLSQADEVITGWKFRPTAITVKALMGMTESIRVANSSKNP